MSGGRRSRVAEELHLSGLGIEVLEAPTTDGVAMSFAPLTKRSMVLVTLTDVDGVVGRGESWVNFPSWAPTERLATYRDGVAPALRECHLGTIEEIHHHLFTRLGPLGRQWGAPGPIAQAISAVDVALWDLAARRGGNSITPPAERVRDSVAVYASSLGPTGIREQAERTLADGHRALKVKLGFGHEADAESVRLIRDIAGPEVDIFVDANQGWSLDEAIAIAPVLRSAGVAWVEEPIRGDRLEDLEAFHRATGLKVATGENLYDVRDFERCATSDAVVAVQPDVSKAGGLTTLAAIARIAEEAHCRVFPHVFNGCLAVAASLQLAALSPAVGLQEWDIRHNPLRDNLVRTPFHLVDGEVEIPRGAGLGVELDHDVVEEYRTQQLELDLRPQ